MRSTCALSVLLPAAAALFALSAQAQEGGKVITTSVPSGGAHKECVSLGKSQQLRYWFRADAPLAFEVQAQSGEKVSRVQRREGTSMGSGTVVPAGAEVYCMVLTNTASRPVTVRLEFARPAR